MVRFADNREREEEILDLVVESYINESRPISSTYLCDKYHLPYSSATVRHVLENLEKRGFLSHIHISSGRVPTKEGFKRYVSNIKEEDIVKTYPIDIGGYSEPVEDFIGHTLDVLTQISGYTSLFALSGRDKKLILRGTRFILEQPEFEDIERLRDLFYILEVRVNEFQDLLFSYLDERVNIVIGDDIGFDEISDCALVVSGTREKDLVFVLGVLGPMRMNYTRAASCLYSIKSQLKRALEELG